MDKRTTGIVAYITWIGLVIALCAGDKEGAKFHLNQSLVIIIAEIICGIVTVVPIIGWIVGGVGSIFLLVCWIMGLIAAINEEEKPVPLIGNIQIIK